MDGGVLIWLPDKLNIIPGQFFLLPFWNTAITLSPSFHFVLGGRRSPAVACWASDHWVASSNPLRGKFRH